jgi:hypothetical protein
MGQEHDDYADNDLPTPTDGPADVLVGVGVYALIGVVLVVLAILLSPLRDELFR